MISRRDWDMCLSFEDVALLEYYDTLVEPPPQPIDESSRAMIAGLEAAAQHAQSILDGTDEEPPGHRVLDGSDLEIAYNRSGDNLVLRVNKGPVQVFRVMLVDVFKHFDERKLFNFNSVSPDFCLKIGDPREGLLAMGRAVGLDADEMRKLEAKAREIAQ